MENQKEREYDSVKALILGIHAPVKNVSRPSTPTKSSGSRPSSPTETSDDICEKPNTLNLNFVKDSPKNSLLMLSPKRHSLQVHHLDSLRIPTLMITGPTSPSHMDNHHRRFSFGLRRHSHSHTVFLIDQFNFFYLKNFVFLS